jgi:hypothetical protein
MGDPEALAFNPNANPYGSSMVVWSERRGNAAWTAPIPGLAVIA